ncbi:ABC transporter substrate-binding protein [Gimesia panareensis]|nr:cobalamin-binding protein [Gimesia panareensis]
METNTDMKHGFELKLILLLLTLAWSAGCGSQEDASVAAQAEQAAKAPASELPVAPEEAEVDVVAETKSFPVTVKDYQGRDVTLAKQPRRIISLLPSHTETLFALGAGAQMVGCTSLCNYPSETKELKQIALANPGSISLETLVALQPDLIVTGGDYHRQLAAQLETLKIPVLALESQSVADIEKAMLGIGQATGHSQQGKALIDRLNQEIAQLQKQIKPFQKEQRPRVFYRVWDQPLMTAGPHSFIGELITLAGGENVFADVEPAYPQVSEETLILRNPEVIVMPRMKEGPADAQQVLEKLRQRPGWSDLAAVKEGRVYLIEDDVISRPGPRVVQGLQKLAQALYPEAFPNP